MKKKLIATLLVLSFVLTLTACGGEAEPANSVNDDVITTIAPSVSGLPSDESEPQTENLYNAGDQTSLMQAFIDEHKNDEFEVLEPFISMYGYIRTVSAYSDNVLTHNFVPDLNIKRNALDIWDVIIELFVEQELPQITDDCNALILMLEEYGIINPTVIIKLTHPNGTVPVSASYPSGEIFVDNPPEEILSAAVDTPEITTSATTATITTTTPVITTTPVTTTTSPPVVNNTIKIVNNLGNDFYLVHVIIQGGVGFDYMSTHMWGFMRDANEVIKSGSSKTFTTQKAYENTSFYGWVDVSSEIVYMVVFPDVSHVPPGSTITLTGVEGEIKNAAQLIGTISVVDSQGNPVAVTPRTSID